MSGKRRQKSPIRGISHMVATGVGAGQRDAFFAISALDPLHRFGGAAETAGNDLVEFLAIRRQRHSGRQAIEQAHAHFLLQRLDLAADRTRRHVQLGRGKLETAMTRRGLKCGQRCQRRQIIKTPRHGSVPPV